MNVYSRNVLLFLALAGAAFGTWMLSRRPEMPESTAIEVPAPSQGYYLVDAVVHGTDDDGRIFYRIDAKRIEQEQKGEDLLLYDMSVRYAPDTNVRWDISAARGRAPANREFLDLLDAVRLEKGAEGDREPMVFEASELRLYVDEYRASSAGQISLRQGQSETTATGLEIDLESDAGRLISDVSIRYRR